MKWASDLTAARIAALLDSLEALPGRLSALERTTAEYTAKLDTLQAALPPKHVSVTEAAAELKVSVPTMRRWVKRGEVPTVKVGNTVRVDLSRLHGADAITIAAQSSAIRRVPSNASRPLQFMSDNKQ
jgi:excisionase family DNA binding protein